MKQLFISLTFLISFSANCFSQIDTTQLYELKGTVVNGINNELLVGANLLINNSKGTKTDEYGEFNIKISYLDTVIISFVGYKSLTYIIPYRKNGEYLTKFKLYKDSIALQEIEIFPWPSYKEFKKAFLAMDKHNEQIKMEGVKMYQDRIVHETYDLSFVHLFVSPASFIYDKLFDKKAKLKRRLNRKRATQKKSIFIDE